MTVSVPQVIDETRRILSDKGVAENQRNKEADIRGAMRMTLADMRRMRPDIFVGSLDALPDVMVADTLPVEDWLFTPLVFLTTGYILMQNDQYSQDGTAAAMVAGGKAQLGTAQ